MRPEAIRCPTCSAGIGVRCRKPRGGSAPHPARVRAVHGGYALPNRRRHGPRVDRVHGALTHEWTTAADVALRAGWTLTRWRKASTVLRALVAEGFAEADSTDDAADTRWRLTNARGLTPGACSVVGALTTEPIPVSELADVVGVPVSIVRATVKRLIRDGLAVDLGGDVVCRTYRLGGKR
jgi:hypothetical protein